MTNDERKPKDESRTGRTAPPPKVLPTSRRQGCSESSAGKMPAARWGSWRAPHDFDAMHWDHEPVRIPLNRPPGTFSPTVAANNLVLWGDPHSNKLIRSIADKLPFVWEAKTVRIGKKSFDSTHHLPVLIYPNPLHPKQYVVLNSGFTFAHPRSTSNAD